MLAHPRRPLPFGLPVALMLPITLMMLVLLGLPSRANAGPPPANELSLGWAPRLILRRDQLGSPRPYVGPGLVAAQLDYRRTKGPNAQRVETDFVKAVLRSQPDFAYLKWPTGEPQETEGSPLTEVRLKYAYLREVPGTGRVRLRLGPGLDFDIRQLDWVLLPSALGAYFGAFALDARAELEFNPRPRHRLRVSAGVPLFAWVTRSPYAINDDALIWNNRDHNGAKTFFRYLADGRMQTWNHYQAVRLALRYDLRLADHWALTFAAHGRVVANQTPRPMITGEFGGTLAVTARF